MSKVEDIKSRIISRLCAVNSVRSPDDVQLSVYKSTDANRGVGTYVYKIYAQIPYDSYEFPEKLEETVYSHEDEDALLKAENCYLLKSRRIAMKALSAFLGEEVEYEDMEFVINSLKLRLKQKQASDE